MGLLDNLRKSYQIKLNQDRINSGLPPLKFDREETAVKSLGTVLKL